MQGEQLRLSRQHQLLIDVELLLALFSSPSFLKQYSRPTNHPHLPEIFSRIHLSQLPEVLLASSVRHVKGYGALNQDY
jgi:hypothetical protein